MAVKRSSSGELHSIKRRRSRRRIRTRRTRRNRGLTLPAELVDDILVRLPVKSIIRFESVCKEWNFKLHSTSFKELYQPKESESNSMKLEDLYKVAPEVQQKPSLFRGRKLGTKISVVGPSSTGIYCLTSIPMDELYQQSVELWRCKIVLCNPGIRHFKFVPPFPSQFRSELDRASFFRNRVVCGFNGSPCCFQVVVVINYGANSSFACFLVFVYSSNSGEWEKLVDYSGKEPVGPLSATWAFTQQILHIATPIEVCSQKLLNGCWHWMVQLGDYGPFVVLSFDFAHQSFTLIKGPATDNVLNRDRVGVDVFVLNDHLAVIYRRQNGWGRITEVCVWMMIDYGVEGSWTKKFQVFPNYEGVLSSALYRIKYSVLQADDEEEGGSDDVLLERLFFTCSKPSGNNEIISLDRHGGHQVTTLRYNPKEDVSFSTGGISSYKETLERLY